MTLPSIFMSRQSLVKAKGFHVATDNFCVVTEFLGVVSRQGILCRDRVWLRPRVFL